MTRSLLNSTTLTLATAAATVLMLASAATAANTRSRALDHAASQVDTRYEVGRKSGSITYLEGVRVRRAMREYRALEARYKADGRLTARERRVLARKLAETRRVVRAASHNSYRRLGSLPRVGR